MFLSIFFSTHFLYCFIFPAQTILFRLSSVASFLSSVFLPPSLPPLLYFPAIPLHCLSVSFSCHQFYLLSCLTTLIILLSLSSILIFTFSSIPPSHLTVILHLFPSIYFFCCFSSLAYHYSSPSFFRSLFHLYSTSLTMHILPFVSLVFRLSSIICSVLLSISVLPLLLSHDLPFLLFLSLPFPA